MAKQSTTSTVREVDEMSAADLLDFARVQRRESEAAEARLLVAAGQWADMHPPESIGGEAVFVNGEHVEAIAGPGCPLVAEFCLAELGAVLGVSTTAAKKLVGHALELRHRLPRLYAQVQAGRVPAWRARLVAEATIHASPALTAESMAWVDAQLAAYAARVGQAQVDRVVEEAIRRQCPPEPADPDHDPGLPDTRRVEIPLDDVTSNGTTMITAEVDLADAIDVDQVLSQHAKVIKSLGSDASLDARRAMALGDLARTQLALDLNRHDDPATPAATPSHPSRAGSAMTGNPDAFTRTATRAAREIVLHLHFNATSACACQGAVPGDGAAVDVDRLGRLEHGQRLVLLDEVKAWCGQSHTRVTVKPVIDLNADLSTDAYTPTDRQREQVILRDRTCAFPWCTRPARRCDLDHVMEFDHDAAAEGRPQPGPTTSSNLGALCRRHHRLKTHGRWKVRALRAGVFEWTSPHGHRYLRDHTGTRALDPDDRSSRHADPPDRP